MFHFAAFFALLATAAAFAPAGRVARSSAMTMQFEDELGVLPPGTYTAGFTLPYYSKLVHVAA